MKIQPKRFLKPRFLYAGYYCSYRQSRVVTGSYQQFSVVISSYQQLVVVLGSYQQLSVVISTYWQLLVVIGSYQQLLVVAGSYQQFVVVILVFTSSYWQLLVVAGRYQQLLVVTCSCWQLLVIAGSYQQLPVITDSSRLFSFASTISIDAVEVKVQKYTSCLVPLGKKVSYIFRQVMMFPLLTSSRETSGLSAFSIPFLQVPAMWH